jgi:hypothetical protein
MRSHCRIFLVQFVAKGSVSNEEALLWRSAEWLLLKGAECLVVMAPTEARERRGRLPSNLDGPVTGMARERRKPKNFVLTINNAREPAGTLNRVRRDHFIACLGRGLRVETLLDVELMR